MCGTKVETHKQAPPPPPPPPPNETPAPPVIDKDGVGGKRKKRGLRELRVPLAPSGSPRTGLQIPQA